MIEIPNPRNPSKNVLAQLGDDAQANWVVLISTPAVARWACNATAAIVQDIIASIPGGSLRDSVDLLYVKYEKFGPVI